MDYKRTFAKRASREISSLSKKMFENVCITMNGFSFQRILKYDWLNLNFKEYKFNLPSHILLKRLTQNGL